MVKTAGWVFFIVVLSRSAWAQWAINEVLADPPFENGDANGDGIRDAIQDEFVEMVNRGGGEVDISGWTLSDGIGVRHVFPAGTVVPGGCSIVVFGGGVPTGDFGFSVVQTASTGALGLNNSGDSVTFKDITSATQAAVTYGAEGGSGESLTRDPDIKGPEPLVLHSTAMGSGGRLFSPGTCVDAAAFPGCSSLPTSTPMLTPTPASTPIPGTAEWVINEILFDPHPDGPPVEPNGDANCDGTRDSSEDEFVEIVNVSGSAQDISGWTIQDGVGIRHEFPPGTIVPDGCAIVVFGGGTPACFFGQTIVQTASTGLLGLNNTGDTVMLTDGSEVKAIYTYGSEGVADESLTRAPDVTGLEPLAPHSSVAGSGGSLHSPGTRVDGGPFPGCGFSTSAERKVWDRYR